MRQSAFWLKASISLIFFAVLVRWLRGHDVRAVLRGTDWRFFILSLAIIPVMVGTSCAKWYLLLKVQGHPVPFRTLFRYYLVGYYFTNLLPSMVGGDVVRWWYSARTIGSQADAAVAVFLERVTGIVLLLALVIVGPLASPGLYRHPAIWIPALGAAGALLALTLLAWAGSSIWKFVNHWAGRGAPDPHPAQDVGANAGSVLFREKLLSKLARVQRRLAVGVEVLRRDRRVGLAVVAWTVAFYMLAAVNVWLAFRTFGPAPSPLRILAVLPTALTVAMIPVTLGSLGIAETSYVFYFSLVGLSPAHIAAMALFLRFKLILLGIVGWFVYLGLDVRVHSADVQKVNPSDATW